MLFIGLLFVRLMVIIRLLVLQMLLIEMLLVRLFVFKMLLVGLLVRLLVGLLFRLLIIMQLLVGLLVLRFLHITLCLRWDEWERRHPYIPACRSSQTGTTCPSPDISASPSPAPRLHSTPSPRSPPSRTLAPEPRLRLSKISSAPGGNVFRLQLMVHVVDVLLYHMLGRKSTLLSDHHQFVLFHFMTLQSDDHIIPL